MQALNSGMSPQNTQYFWVVPARSARKMSVTPRASRHGTHPQHTAAIQTLTHTVPTDGRLNDHSEYWAFSFCRPWHFTLTSGAAFASYRGGENNSNLTMLLLVVTQRGFVSSLSSARRVETFVCLRVHTASQPRATASYPSPWEHQISQEGNSSVTWTSRMSICRNKRCLTHSAIQASHFSFEASALDYII
jgi:hypothetical protein